MYELLWLVPALPLAGFLALALPGTALSARAVPMVGAGSVGLSALVTVYLSVMFAWSPPEGGAFTQSLWEWMTVGEFAPSASLRLDPLSLVAALVVTVVGFLIHIYSGEYMEEDDGARRFFAYMNLFTASMLILVLSGDLLFLYLGWEGVGLCSYLLIGFWYKEEKNGLAARKAFIVTRTADTLFALGLIVLFTGLGSTDIQELMGRASVEWRSGPWATVAAALLLCGALGKSAQLPFQAWLPDAMAGPTPVSALIHAATMVTAGVYLIARTRALFELAPMVLVAVAAIGAATLLLGAFCALVQRDIKRILAYSTISQVGYMFMALGAGAWSAAVFHFMTHAFFKALLFLGAGAIILGAGHEHDIFRMGGMRRQMPLVFWTFLAGAASLAAVPFVTAGFFSKDLILHIAWASGPAGPWLWACGMLGAFLTALYAFRMVFVVFFGAHSLRLGHRPGTRLGLPLVVLAVLSVAGGLVETPWTRPLLSEFLAPVLPGAANGPAVAWLSAAGAIVPAAGIAAAWFLFCRRAGTLEAFSMRPAPAAARSLWLAGWYFDRLYEVAVVRPYLRLVRALRDEPVDSPFRWLERASVAASRLLARTQNGNLRWYAAGISAGAVLAVFAAVVL